MNKPKTKVNSCVDKKIRIRITLPDKSSKEIPLPGTGRPDTGCAILRIAMCYEAMRESYKTLDKEKKRLFKRGKYAEADALNWILHPTEKAIRVYSATIPKNYRKLLRDIGTEK